jgi:hypothetical protein
LSASKILAAPAALVTAAGLWLAPIAPIATTAVETAIVAGRVAAPAIPVAAAAVETVVVAGRAAAPVAGFTFAKELPEITMLAFKDYRRRFLRSTRDAFVKSRERPDGLFVDDLTGQLITKAEVSVDHVIPLATARDALGVNTREFVDFANDPANLIITTIRNNAAKGKADLLTSTAMFPEATVDLSLIGKQVADAYRLTLH